MFFFFHASERGFDCTDIFDPSLSRRDPWLILKIYTAYLRGKY
jgi:hypothetical protein